MRRTPNLLLPKENRITSKDIAKEFPVMPTKEDKYAIEFIVNVRKAFENVEYDLYIDSQQPPRRQIENIDMYIQEAAQQAVPRDEYIAANAFAQLGLFRLDYDDMIWDKDENAYISPQAQIMYSIQVPLFLKAEEIIRKFLYPSEDDIMQKEFEDLFD